MLKYFIGVETIEELKKKYKELAKKHHPDLGGNKEKFQEINNEYDKLLENLKSNKKANTKDNDNFKDIINELIKYNELTIEIIGSWLWVSGNTYPLRDSIKKLGMLWSKGRKKWYYTNDNVDYKNTHYKKKTYEQLKNDYGCSVVKHTTKDKDKNYLK